MAQTAPPRVPFQHGAAATNGQQPQPHAKPPAAAQRKRGGAARMSAPPPAAPAPQVPPSPSEFPSLGGSSSPPVVPQPPPAATVVVPDSSQASWATVSSAVRPQAPKGSVVSRLQPSSTGPTSPYSRPTPSSEPAAASSAAATKLPRHQHSTGAGPSKRAGSLPRSSTTSAALSASSSNHGKKKPAAGHRKSQSQSRLPTYSAHSSGSQHLHQQYNPAANNTVPATLLKPLSPKSSSLSPLAPSFSFKPRSSTSPQSSSAPTSSTESSPARRTSSSAPRQPLNDIPHFVEDLPPNAPDDEPSSSSSSSLLLDEQAPVGLGLTEASEMNESKPTVQQHQEQRDALLVDEQPPSSAVRDEQAANDSDDVASTVPEAAQPEKIEESPASQAEVIAEDTRLPEPLVHALENKVEDAVATAAAEKPEHVSEGLTEQAVLPEPLVHAIENKVEREQQETAVTQEMAEEQSSTPAFKHKIEQAASAVEHQPSSDGPSADEADLATAVEQVPAALAQRRDQQEQLLTTATDDIPVTAEEIAAEESLADVLDVDELPANELKEEMDKLETAQVTEVQPQQMSSTDEAKALAAKAPSRDVGDEVDGPAHVRSCSAPTWEPFEDPESLPAAISQTRIEEGQNDAILDHKGENEGDEDESSTPRPVVTQTALSSQHPTRDQSTAESDAVSVEQRPISEEQTTSSTDLVTSDDTARRPPTDNGSSGNGDGGRDPNSDEAPSLTMAIVNAWHSTTWAKRIPAIIASIAINFGLPFVNGVMLGFGELFARNWIGIRMGWGNPFRAPGLSSEPPASGARTNTANVGLRGSSTSPNHPLSGSAGVRTAVEAAEQEALDLAHHA
ncbi:hypothetical protein OIV83_002522 [Microbotryomycetes sp. JL201]|nr:hypothetical protein OIV83_002522 [Microbotryomycetes sp. JL201]